jgi:diadenosine tetraphosphate (Ap4A) HIT family hydrolase
LIEQGFDPNNVGGQENDHTAIHLRCRWLGSQCSEKPIQVFRSTHLHLIPSLEISLDFNHASLRMSRRYAVIVWGTKS